MLALLFFSACTRGAAPPPPPPPERTGKVVVGLPSVGALDPAIAAGNGLLTIALACEPLLTLNPESLEPEPALVQSWQYKADAQSVILRLRKGLRFQDGAPFNAQVVADNLSRVAAQSVWRTLIASMASVRVTGATSLEISFSRPDADFVSLLAHPALTPVLIHPDGTQACVGPYRIETAGEGGINLTAFEGYEPAAGNAREIVVRMYESNDAAFEALKTGEVDLAPISEARYAGGEAEGWEHEMAPGNSVAYFAFNPQRPETASSAFRQAVSMSLDRLAIIDVGFGDGRLPLSGWNAGGRGAAQSAGCRAAAPRKADLQGAATKLAESGVASGVSFPMYFDQSRLTRIVANSIEVQVKSAIGVVLKSEPTEAAGIDSTLRGGTVAGVWVLNAESDSPIPGRLMSRLFETGSSANSTGSSDATFDQALAAARSRVDSKERIASYIAAEEIVCGSMVAAPLWSGVKHWVFDSKKLAFKGARLDAWGDPILRHAKPR